MNRMFDRKICAEKFLELTSSDQTRLRIFMALMSVNNIFIFVVSQFNIGIFSWIGILLNVIVLYWSLDIKRAPSFYYRLIMWSFWFVLIFNGLHFTKSILRYPHLEISAIGSLVNLVLIYFFAQSILRYRKTVIESEQKSVRKITTVPTLTLTEEERIRFWVRTVGTFLTVWSMANWMLSDQFRNLGITPDGLPVIAMGLIAAAGLFSFQQNLGRRLCLFVCLVLWVEWLFWIFEKRISGYWEYLYSILVIAFFFGVFLFLLHPKTKAVFK